MRLVNCMVHIRRHFEHALDENRPMAEHALKEIQHLYKIEHMCDDAQMSFDERKAKRQELSKPIMEAMKMWMETEGVKYSESSQIGKAITYAYTRWGNMMRYLEDGRLLLDNNLAENEIRPITLVTFVLAHFFQSELLDQRLQLFRAVVAGLTGHFQHCHNIVFHAQFAEHAGLLRQIADTSTGTLIHRKSCDLLIIDEDMTRIGYDQTCSHVERGGLTSTIRSQQSHNLSLSNIDVHIVHHRSLPITLHQSFGTQDATSGFRLRLQYFRSRLFLHSLGILDVMNLVIHHIFIIWRQRYEKSE